jgi:hypothetical protein
MPRQLNPIGYNGDPDLPLPTEEVSLTAEELAEFIRCQNDPIYFISNHVKIQQVDPDDLTGERIVKFTPYPFQRDIINSLQENRFVIAKLPRQCGKSSVIVCGYFLWYILFNTDVSVAILANTEDTAIMLLKRMKASFRLLPRFLKQGIEKWDEKQIVLANKTRVRAAATSASAIRGDTFNIVFLDEFAFVPANIANEFMASVFPVISSGKTTKLFIVSTPQGFNLFYKIFADAERQKNVYKALAYTWRDVYFARNPGASESDALKWKDEAIQLLANDAQKFAQEYECDFLGSSNSLIGPWKLATLSFGEPLRMEGSLRVYEKPVYLTEEGPAHVYICTVDVAQGQEKDSSVVQVIDITLTPFRQVAVYQDKSIKPAQLAPVIVQLARSYNDAFLFFEINGEALLPAQLCQEELEYSNMIQVFMHKKKGQQLSSGFHPTARIGLKSSEATKRIGATGLKSLIENDQLLLRDYETIQQLTTFVGRPDKRTGLSKVYEAEVGNHDDLVTPLVLLGWLSAQSGFENYINLPMRKLLMEGRDPLDIEPPFAGFFNDPIQNNIIDTNQFGFEVAPDDPDFWL